MKIALAQIDTKVGDLDGNTNKIIDFTDRAEKLGADLVVFSELAITGYPPKDLLDFEYFVEDNISKLEEIKKYTRDKNIAIICGYVDINPASYGRKYYNAAALIHKGEIISKHYKSLLPFYDVFDETRYFEPGKDFNVVDFMDKKLGITICEDVWNDKYPFERSLYKGNPVSELTSKGAEVIINISASPYHLNKEKQRFEILEGISDKYKTPIVYVNQVGGNDDLLFDGVSFAVGKDCQVKALCSDFKEDIVIYDLDNNDGEQHKISQSEEESLLKALKLGVKDYCRKVGYKKVIVGLSGGIDSALTAVIASYALGSENVLGITMPSMYSSEGSVSDSEKLAKNLGIEYLEVPIKNIFDSYIKEIQDGKILMDLAEENLQARIRANILMMYSNRYNSLLLTTGNKSEISVGYCTLYGDMAGGLAPISDVPKTMVYRLAKYINSEKEIIPEDVITKAPSAELRPDQTDQDTLPPYDILDGILKEYVEEQKNPSEIVKNYPKEMVEFVIKRINNNEYKRKQAALGLKVTTKAFGTGRRFPIVQGYDFRLK